jgi:galactokinase
MHERMNEQHALLRNPHALSLPRIEDLRSAALEAGAYGAKISGARLGGSIIALVNDEQVYHMLCTIYLSQGETQP